MGSSRARSDTGGPFWDHGLARGYMPSVRCGSAWPRRWLLASHDARALAPADQPGQEDRSLPPSNFGSVEDKSAASLKSIAPGFAHAVIATNPAAASARPVGEKVCTSCHALESKNFAHTVHALGLHAAAEANPNTPTCETCHGAGSTHGQQPTVKGSIIGFTKGSGTPIKVQTRNLSELSRRRTAQPLARLRASALRSLLQRLP